MPRVIAHRRKSKIHICCFRCSSWLPKRASRAKHHFGYDYEAQFSSDKGLSCVARTIAYQGELDCPSGLQCNSWRTKRVQAPKNRTTANIHVQQQIFHRYPRTHRSIASIGIYCTICFPPIHHISISSYVLAPRPLSLLRAGVK